MVRVSVDRQLLEYMVLFLPVQIVGGRNGEASHPRETLRRGNVPHLNQAVGILERKWPQQYRVHYAEDGSVRSHAKRQHDDRNGREAGRLAQHSSSEMEIMKQSFH